MECPLCERGMKPRQMQTRNVFVWGADGVKQVTLDVLRWWRIDMRTLFAAIVDDVEELGKVIDVPPQPIMSGGRVTAWSDPALQTLDKIEGIADWYIKNGEPPDER